MGSGPWLPVLRPPHASSPQGHFKLECLPDDPDVAQDAGTVDALVHGTCQAAPAPDRAAQETACEGGRCGRPPPPPQAAQPYLLAMRK